MTRQWITNRLRLARREVTLRRSALTFVLAFNLRNFQYFPGGRSFEELYFVLCLTAFVCIYPIFKIRMNWRFSRYELYLLATMLVMTVLPATSAYRVFGQPLVYGILAKRSIVLLGSWILFLNAWRFGYFNLRDIERSLLSLVWFITALFAFMRVFLDPTNFPSAPVGWILGYGVDRSFAVPGYLLPFGVLYYLRRGVRTHQVLDYVFGLTIFFVAAGSSWRALTLSLAGALLFFTLRQLAFDKAVLWVLRCALIGALSVGVLEIVRPQAVTNAATHLVEALKVASGSGPGNDASANARISETETALPYVRSNPVLGSGLLSVQWNGGEGGVLGVYFSDTDIGLIGVLFTIGIVGLLVGLAQYGFAFAAARRLPARARVPFTDAAVSYVLFSFLFSLTTGMFINELETTSFFVLLLYQASYESIESRTSNMRPLMQSVEAMPMLISGSSVSA